MDVKQAIEKRRSVRSFIDKEINPDYIMEMIDAARQAPSSGNLQSWKFILVKNQHSKNEISDACFQQNWIASAPTIIVVIALVDEVKRHYGVRGEMLYSIQNCALAIQNMMLRATELGISGTIVSAFEEGMIKRTLSLPDHVRPQAIIPVGYSSEKPAKKLLQSIESMTYFEKWYNRIEDWDEAFYMWSGIMKKHADKILSKVKKGGLRLKDKVRERLGK